MDHRLSLSPKAGHGVSVGARFAHDACCAPFAHDACLTAPLRAALRLRYGPPYGSRYGSRPRRTSQRRFQVSTRSSSGPSP